MGRFYFHKHARNEELLHKLSRDSLIFSKTYLLSDDLGRENLFFTNTTWERHTAEMDHSASEIGRLA
jgi:hypothetical protein